MRGQSSSDVTFASCHGNNIVWASAYASGQLEGKTLGQKVRFSYNETSMIFSFNSVGGLMWKQEISGAELLGIDHLSNGNIVALVNIEYEDENANGLEIGYLPRLIPNKPLEAGIVVLEFSKMGQYIKLTRLQGLNKDEIEVFNFKVSPTGDYIIAGGADPGVISDTIVMANCGKAGGDFVGAYSKTGVPLWIEVISYKGDRCCSRAGGETQLVIDNEGVVYFSGVFMRGATFGNKVALLAAQTIEEKQKNRQGSETYLACYSASGKFQWVKSSGNKGRVCALAVDENQVYLGYSITGNMSFEQQVDSGSKNNCVIVSFNKKGKVNWQFSAKGKIDAMTLDKDGNVVFVGEIRNYEPEPVKLYGKVVVKRTDHVLITALTPKGKFKYGKTNALFLSSRNSVVRLVKDGEGNLYTAGLIWCGLPIGMNLLDEALPNDDCYGGVNFLARIK